MRILNTHKYLDITYLMQVSSPDSHNTLPLARKRKQSFGSDLGSDPRVTKPTTRNDRQPRTFSAFDLHVEEVGGFRKGKRTRSSSH
ncbi:hypothetical protein Q7C36_013183 [Tachysurus vachellii]|uniref:Uncharacterized protein n=1 Tax=Tachysurus vachellii TaxID=175792 RepID=A0AA88MHJ6_TACVA|nr:hypothetical protein Q7C36_013183 [Tachysurus vachellii]